MIPSRLLVVTDRHGSGMPLVETVRAVLDGGARWIWFRDKDLERAARRDLALELLALTDAAAATLTIGSDATLAAEIGADGVHWGMASLDQADAERSNSHPVIASKAKQSRAEARSAKETGLLRFARNDGQLASTPSMGVSAHGLGDVQRAAARGVDYATLSPIFPTSSKPGYGPALGLDGVRAACALGLPIIALGGVTHTNARSCVDAGAAGVAVMGAIMRASDPAVETRRLLAALDAAT